MHVFTFSLFKERQKSYCFWKWVFVYRHWCEENEMVFVSHEVPFPATSDRRSRVAGNGTEWEVKTIELSSSTSGGEQWAFLHFFILTAVKKTVPKWRKFYLLWPTPLWIIVPYSIRIDIPYVLPLCKINEDLRSCRLEWQEMENGFWKLQQPSESMASFF